MARCGLCGGFGRVAAGGIAGQLAEVFGAEIHECAPCHGTGRVSADKTGPVPRPRTPLPRADLSATLPGECLVEIHGFGRIRAVMRFLLVHDGTTQRFDARCDFGGVPGWVAKGEWTNPDPGNVIRFAGTQSSPYHLTTAYGWGATLNALRSGVLHGESIADEWTMWSRKLDVTTESEPSEIVRMAMR